MPILYSIIRNPYTLALARFPTLANVQVIVDFTIIPHRTFKCPTYEIIFRWQIRILSYALLPIVSEYRQRTHLLCDNSRHNIWFGSSIYPRVSVSLTCGTRAFN